MKIKVSDAAGPVLDWMVAKAEGLACRFQPHFITLDTITYCADWDRAQEYAPSTDWSQGGPIIERELIGFRDSGGPGNWHASFDRMHLTFDGKAKQYHHQFGPTPLIAAMRCFVASRLGDEVDVPEELL